MKANTDDRRIWIESAILAILSASFALFMNKYFARYRPRYLSGNTTVAPSTKAEENAKAAPARRALERATAQVDSPEKANQVVERLEELTGDTTTGDVEQAKRPEAPGKVAEKVAESSRRIEQAARFEPPVEKAADTVAQAAKEITTSPGPEKAALAEATTDAFNPEQKGTPEANHPRQRQLLREAVLKRMKPFDALDARLFLLVNQLPHNRWINGFFSFFTLVFTGGIGWYALLALVTLANPRKGIRAARHAIMPLGISSSLVEYPIKTFVRRRRPFIAFIQAIVIGKKPGSWSFPSGHSASAFAGAWLLSRDFPAQRPLLFLIAALVAFSRIYLGDHYPGDVVSGAFSGMALAESVRRGERMLEDGAGTWSG